MQVTISDETIERILQKEICKRVDSYIEGKDHFFMKELFQNITKDEIRRQLEEDGEYICSLSNNKMDENNSDKFYVYVFINDDWNGMPFYVGKGRHNRYKSLYKRNKHIISICEKSNWHPEIVQYFENERDSLIFEKELKKKYKQYGFPIIDSEINNRLGSQTEAINRMPIDPTTGKRKSLKTGRTIGRPAITLPDNWDIVYPQWKNGSITAVQAMELMSLKKNSFYKLVKQFKKE